MKTLLVVSAILLAVAAAPLAAADCVPDVKCNKPHLLEPACTPLQPTVDEVNNELEVLVCG